MAEVYDYVQGVRGNPVEHIMPNGDIKQSRANQLERFIALQEEVQLSLLSEGMKIFQRARFRMSAVQARHEFRLREELSKALKSGDPKFIRKAQGDLDYYLANKTEVIYSQADVDFHIMLYRPDGRELFVEVDGEGDRGFEILKKSLTG